MSHEEIRILVVLFGFVGVLGIFAGVCIWATRGSDEIETFLDELDDERAQKRRY
ncbi:hypothetical protein [Ralstonia insidiosa]|uniref:hypothetical protein n=1 Tax=Ralstonia insidiosa TaxID=190721 RepID=UPI001427B1EC|nr:hypothetical protein [Ralstonia insidiosa]